VRGQDAGFGLVKPPALGLLAAMVVPAERLLPVIIAKKWCPKSA
jgi:hypothetical protein